jgi:transposase
VKPVVRHRPFKPPLFYATTEIAAAAPGGFYARLEAALAGRWEQLAQPLRAAFTEGVGRPTDPQVYLKCFLIGYFENLLYDTDLAERLADSIALRTFLGYTLTERTPDHSSLSRVRQALGEQCLIEEVLAAVVQACVEAGLVSGEVVAVDASLLPANAALSSLRSLATGKSVREHLQEVRARNRERKEGEPKEPETLSNGEFASATDAEAKIARKPGVRRGLYYRATHVTDGAHQILLAVQGGDAEEGEAEAARAPLTQAAETLEANGLALGAVAADAGYDDADFDAHVESLGGQPLTHLQKEGSSKPAGFRKSDFRYLAEADCYQCPRGQHLPRCKRHTDRIEYRAPGEVCLGCPDREACVGKSKSQTRSLWRVTHEASRERTAAAVATPEGRALRKRRGGIVEGPFGHMKAYGGLRRLNCRGQGKVHVRVVLAAVAWNLIKLVAARFPKAALARAGAEVRVAGGPSHGSGVLARAERPRLPRDGISLGTRLAETVLSRLRPALSHC